MLFPALHSYRFIVLIEILPFSLMFDVCLSSLLSPCHRTLTISHWQRCLRQWRRDLGLDTFLVFKTYISSFIRISSQYFGQQLADFLPSFLPAHRPFRHRDALYNKKLKQFSAAEADTPEEPLCVDCQCCFWNLGAEGPQHAEEDTRVEEDKQTSDSRKEGRAYCEEGVEAQWWPFRHVNLQRHPSAKERLMWRLQQRVLR